MNTYRPMELRHYKYLYFKFSNGLQIVWQRTLCNSRFTVFSNMTDCREMRQYARSFLARQTFERDAFRLAEVIYGTTTEGEQLCVKDRHDPSNLSLEASKLDQKKFDVAALELEHTIKTGCKPLVMTGDQLHALKQQAQHFSV